jgi:ubiquinone biosynthesis protein UbiJ
MIELISMKRTIEAHTQDIHDLADELLTQERQLHLINAALKNIEEHISALARDLRALERQLENLADKS